MKAFIVLCCLAASILAKDLSADVEDVLRVAGDDAEPSRSARSPQLRIQHRLDSSEYSDDDRLPSSGFSSYWPWQAIPYAYGNTYGRRQALPPPVLLVPVPVPSQPTTECEVKPNKNKVVYEEEYEEPKKPKRPTRPPPVQEEEEEEEAPKPKPKPKPLRPAFPSYVRPEELDKVPANPVIKATASSKELLEQFLAQVPQSPELPPVLLSDHDASERIPLPDDDFLGDQKLVLVKREAQVTANKGFYQPSFNFGSGFRSRDPSRPQFNQNLVLRGELTVPRAGYTETYISRVHPATGSSRVDFHGGATMAFKTVMPDGSLQRLEVRVDKSGDELVRRCGKATSAAVDAADHRNPALPNIELFSFVGYEQTEGGRLERWRYVSSGQPGELGGAKGEALTTRHDLLLVRSDNDSAIPITYTVQVDSSLLGPSTDGYEHRYYVIQENQRDAKFFQPNLDELCDVVERLNPENLEHRARLDPLREYTMTSRDPRYDTTFSSFKTEYNRQYLDNLEESARKNLLIQHERFVSSANREGAPFALEKNFLTDRLNVEIQALSGVVPSPEIIKGEEFPHRRSTIRKAEASLPKKFDWRARGAVSPVQFQGECSSCWAFAVAGSVEGALFVRTRRLVPLSQQCLVDCAHPFGGKGCKGTWPSHAFNYVQEKGLPALDEYPTYKAKVEKCEDQTVPAVTKISAHVNVTANSVSALKIAIRRHAPTVVIVDSQCKSFQFYKKGVLYDDRCSKGPRKLDHAVLAVGWGEKKGEPNFILKNSWSDKWGDHGYIRVQGPANTCGVLAKPSYPRLEETDILRDIKPDQESSRIKTRDTDAGDYDEEN